MANPGNAKAVAKASKNVVVSPDTRKPDITIDNSKPRTAELNQPYDVYQGVTAALESLPITDIAAKVANKTTGAEIAITDGKVTFTEAGTYVITYTVKNPNNPDMETTREFEVVVMPNEDVSPDTPDSTQDNATKAK